MTPSYAETLRPTTSESTAAAPATEAPLGITRAPALNGLCRIRHRPLGWVSMTVEVVLTAGSSRDRT